jgi:hypothetical protein
LLAESDQEIALITTTSSSSEHDADVDTDINAYANLILPLAQDATQCRRALSKILEAFARLLHTHG